MIDTSWPRVGVVHGGAAFGRLTSAVVLVVRFRAKTEIVPADAFGSRTASDSKATTLPLALITGLKLKLVAIAPPAPVARLTSVTAPVVRFLTKMSPKPFESPGTRFGASLWNATTLPSALMVGGPLLPAATVPSAARLTNAVVPVWLS